jgi:hypothetical protein
MAFFDIENAFDTTWHPDMLHRFSKLKFSADLLNILAHSNPQKIRSYGRRRNIYTKSNTSRGATKFRAFT